MEQKFIEMSKVIFASIDHYRESGRDDKFNIDSIAEYLQRQFLLQQTPCTTQLLSDSSTEDEYCKCKRPTLGKSVSRCGTCDCWFRAIA